MASSKQLNDWADVIRAQSELFLKQTFEEKNLEAVNKELYKQELENQLRHKELQKIKEKQEAEQEKNLVTEQIRNYQAFQQRNKEEKQSLRNYLSSEYTANIQNKSLVKREENFRNLKEEQVLLNNAKTQLENLMEFNRSVKTKQVEQEKDFFWNKMKEKDDAVVKKFNEKKTDQDLIHENIDRISKREQEFHNNIKKIDQQRSERMKKFEPVINELQKKESSQNSIITSWENQVQRKQKEEELRRLREKLENKRKLAEGLKYQLQDKERKQNQILSGLDLEKIQMSEHINSYRKDTENWRNSQIKSQKDYFEFLQNQKADFDFKKSSQNLMSPKEKDINKDILRKIDRKEEVQFTGVPGLHPRVSPLQNSFLRAYNGSSDSVNISHLRSSSQNFQHYSEIESQGSQKLTRFQAERYNPITNPISDHHPVVSNTPYYRGNGMKFIQPTNIFKKN